MVTALHGRLIVRVCVKGFLALSFDLKSASPSEAAIPLKMTGSYRGRVIAPSEADETSAAYFPNTPPGYFGCGAFHCAIR